MVSAWLKLTGNGEKYLVNVSQIAYVMPADTGAWVCFASAKADGRVSLRVDQSYDTISNMLSAKSVAP